MRQSTMAMLTTTANPNRDCNTILKHAQRIVDKINGGFVSEFDWKKKNKNSLKKTFITQKPAVSLQPKIINPYDPWKPVQRTRSLTVSKSIPQ